MISQKIIIKEILKHFPNPKIELKYDRPWQLYISVVLSAQCTDEVVNEVTKRLFDKYPDIDSYLKMENKELEDIIYSTGFYKNKAKTILNAAKFLWEKYEGKLPSSMKELIRVPGLGRKSANVILSSYFGRNEGIVVDTHVKRVSGRLDLSRHKDPVKIEKDLILFFNKENWSLISIGLVLFGRYICKARKPLCTKCSLTSYCNYFSSN